MTDYYKEFVDDLDISIPGGVGGAPGRSPEKEPQVGPYRGMEDVYLQQVEQGTKEVKALKELNVGRPPAPTMIDQFFQGVQDYRQSVDHSLEYMFGADDARKTELRSQAEKQQLAESRRPPAYQIGREILPWFTPGGGAKKLPMQMVESALTSLGLDVLDFDKQPTTGGMSANAVGAALAPIATRGISRLSPVGTPGTVSRDALEIMNPTRRSRVSRLQKRGYRMTPAEATGSSELQRTERQALKNRRRGPGVAKELNKLTEHNNQVSNRIVGDALGMPPMVTSLPEEALGRAHKRIRKNLDSVVKDTTLRYDPQFNKDLHQLKGTYNDPELKRMMKIDPEAKAELDHWIRDASINRKLSGESWQVLGEQQRSLADAAFTAGKSPLGHVHLGIADALEEMMTRQIGEGRLPRYKKLKKQYAVSEMVAGDRYKDMVDVDGNINPDKVRMALERKRSVRKHLNRGGEYSPLDIIRDYSMLSENKKVLPLGGSKGIVEDIINMVPEIGGGTIPAKMYLRMGSRLPLSQARKSAAGRVGTHVGSRAGGTEMESALWNAIIGGQKGQGLDLIPYLQQGIESTGKFAGDTLTGRGASFWGGP